MIAYLREQFPFAVANFKIFATKLVIIMIPSLSKCANFDLVVLQLQLQLLVVIYLTFQFLADSNGAIMQHQLFSDFDHVRKVFRKMMSST